jgi:hypothetical protein
MEEGKCVMLGRTPRNKDVHPAVVLAVFEDIRSFNILQEMVLT